MKLPSKTEQHVFHCQLPVFICPTCSKAEGCKDLAYLLKTYKLDEKPSDRELLEKFPFLKLEQEQDEEEKTVHPRNKLNEMASGEWLQFTRSVLSQKFPLNLGHELRRAHPEAKSPYLMGQLISFFTRGGESVLDPFAGCGPTLIAATLLDREAIGFEVRQEWIDIYYRVCDDEGLAKQNLTAGNCGHLIKFLPMRSVDFVIVDPPLLGSEDEEQAGLQSGGADETMEEIHAFFRELFEFCARTLASRRYMAVFVKNLYRDGKFHKLEPFYISAAESAKFTLKGEKIWENPAERMRPYGYPYSYVPNITHHTILIFQKDN